MSSTVDNRVVEAQFNNKQFEENVKTTIKSLDNLKKGLNLSDSAKSLNTLANAGRTFSLAGIADGVSVISDRFSALGIIGMTVLQNLTTAAMNLGRQMLNTIVLGPLRQGFAEYETQMNAIQTILANTQNKGTTLDQVNESLNELNKYADKTIYNFTEMAKNIGTFTAAGISLETSTAAIKGIGNLAAVSGSNSQQAAVAMYQLSQALSSGTVRLMDWNSVVNAGMGGQVFQDALKETARLHKVSIDDMIKKEGSFRETLQKGWLTSEILTETLSKFTGDLTAEQLKTMGYTEEQIAGILKLGVTANDAATKVKTFSQLSQTLMEALQSGWAQTWQIVIGDFEEAKAFMTEVSDVIGGFVQQNSDARNSLLAMWKSVGGRANLIDALRNAFKGLLSILKPISEAIKEVFPPLTYRQLQTFTLGIVQFSKKLIIGDKAAKNIKLTVKSIATVLSIAWKAVSALVGGLGRLFDAIKPVSFSFSDMITSITDWLVSIREAITLNDTFNKAIDKIAIFLGKARDSISNFASIVSIKFKEIKDKISDLFKNIDTSGFTKFINVVKLKFESLTGVADFVSNIFDGIKKMIVWISPFIKKIAEFIGNAFSNIGEFISKNIQNADFDTVFDGLNVGLLTALVIAVSKFLKGGTDTFGGIKGILDGVRGILDSVRGGIEAWQKSIKADTLMKIAGAIAILAVSLIALAMVDSERLTIAIVAITTMFADLLGSMAVFNKVSNAGVGDVVKISVLMISLSIAIGILAGSIARLGNIDTPQLIQGLIGLSVLMGEVLLFSKLLASNSTGVIKGSAGLIGFALALGILTKVIEKLGGLQIEVLKQGLVTLGILLGSLSIFTNSLGNGKNVILTAVSITIIAASMLIFANALQKLGSMPIDQIINGLTAMVGIFAILIVAMRLLPKDMFVTAISLTIVSAALLLLSQALATMGSMSWDEIGRGLTVLAGSLLILGIAMYAMTGALPGAAALFVMAGAIAILAPALKALGGMSIAEIGKSLLMLAGMFVVLGLAALVLAPLTPIILALGAAMFLLGIGVAAVGVGMLAFAAGLATLALTGVAGAAVLAVVITQLLSLIPMIVNKLGEALLLFLQKLIDSIPLTMVLVETFLLGVIAVIVKVIPKIIDAIFLLVTSLLQTLASYLPQIVQAGYDIILALLNGIANNIGGIVESAFNIIINFTNAIAKKIPQVVQSGWNLIIKFVDGLTAAVETNMPRLMESLTKLGIAVVEGFANGIKNSFHLAFDAVKELGEKVLDKLKNILDSHSPSRETESLGEFFVIGFVNGINALSGLVYDSIDNLASTSLNSLSNAISNVASSVSDNLDLTPTIRPVVDLTDVMSSKEQLSTLFGRKSLNLSLSTDRVSALSKNMVDSSEIQNGSLLPNNQATNVSLTQINNSPVALSRLEIYRQTRNQLIALKGLVNNT